MQSEKVATVGSGKSRREYWRRVLETWSRSGVSQTAFCREQGLSRNAFTYWKRQMGIASRRRGGFVELRSRLEPVVSRKVEIRLRNGMRMSVDSGCDPAGLAEMVRALEAL